MKTKYFIPVMAGVMLLGVSCSESFLDLKPRTAQTSETFFATSNDAYKALIGVYEKLRAERPNVYEPLQLVTDIMSDDAYAGGGSASDMLSFQKISRFNEVSNGTVSTGLWKKGYTAIQRANTLLANYDNITFKTNETAVQASYKAEAMFLRGHFYFELARFFGNIPLITKPVSGEEWKGVTQNSADEVYAQIGKDMTEAILALPASYDAANKGRITVWAAKAELLKVYMFYTGYYGKTELPVAGGSAITKTMAIAIAEDIITNSGATLTADYAKIFTPEGDFSKEVLFEIPYANTSSGDWGSDSPLGNIGCVMSGPRGYDGPTLAEGWSFCIPTHELANAFEAGDVRKNATIITAKTLIDEKPALTAGYTHTGLYTNKYTTHAALKATTGAAALNYAQNYHYIRLSDILLIAAELNLTTDPGKALGYLNRVRNRAGVTPKAAITLDVIYAERRVELAMEGHRYFDVLRRGLDYAKQQLDVTNYVLAAPEATNTKYLNDKGQNLTGDIGNTSEFEVVFDKVKAGFLPIPQKEIDLNNKLKQNNGYN